VDSQVLAVSSKLEGHFASLFGVLCMPWYGTGVHIAHLHQDVGGDEICNYVRKYTAAVSTAETAV
jgi:hypothetical protein